MLEDLKKILEKKEYNEEDKQKISKILNDFIAILEKQEFAEEDKEQIVLFASNDFFKTIGDNFFLDKNIRGKLMQISDLYYLKENELRKQANMFVILTKSFISSLKNQDFTENCSSEELDQMLFDFYNCATPGSGDSLDYMNLLMSKLSPNEFLNSKSFKRVAQYMRNKKKTSYYEKYLNNYFKFARTLFSYLVENVKNGIEIDDEHVAEEFLEQFPDEMQEKIRAYVLLLYKDAFDCRSDDGREILESVSAYIAGIIDDRRENQKELSSNDKELIRNFRRKCLHKVFAIINNSDSERLHYLFEVLVRTFIYEFDLNSDNEFFFSTFDKLMFADKLESISQPDLKILNYLSALSTIGIDPTALFDFIEKQDESFDFTNLEATKTYIESYIRQCLKGNEITQQENDFVRKYLQKVLNNKDLDIFQEQYLCDIMQLVDSGRIEEPFQTKVKDLLQKHIENLKIDPKKEENYLLQWIKENADTGITEENFGIFYEHLQRLKLSNYRINNKEILEFVLKLFLDEKSIVVHNSEKYQPLLERIKEL